MSIRSRVLALAAGVTLLAGTGLAATVATAGSASAAPPPLPAYPATTTLDLGSPYCVTDDVIMDDPLDSTSPITDTAGATGAGSPTVFSHAVPPINYYLWYLDKTSNTWVLKPPPGTQISPITGEIDAYSGTATIGPPPDKIAGDIYGLAPAPGTAITYTVRDHGKDTVGAVGTEQFQLEVIDTSGGLVSVLYEGNTFNNANGALTIQLNGGSTTSTALTLAAIPSSLNIPDIGGVGSTPVTFTLLGPAGWHLEQH